MDPILGWILGGVIAVLAIWALIMGRKFRRGRVRVGTHIAGEVEGSAPGATVSRAQAEGWENRITAEGEGSSVDRVKASGVKNVIGASNNRNK
jgi:hypothetical protein